MPRAAASQRSSSGSRSPAAPAGGPEEEGPAPPEPPPEAHREAPDLAIIQIGPGQDALASVDGDKGASGWWYPLLHVTKQALFQFEQRHGRLPAPNDAADAEIADVGSTGGAGLVRTITAVAVAVSLDQKKVSLS